MGYQIGIVLGGGGIRGVAHIALLQILKERGISPMYISGASSGALVGAMSALNLPVTTQLQFFREASLFRLSYLTLTKGGILNTNKYEPYLKQFFGDTTFEQLNQHLIVSATNFSDGQPSFFESGPLNETLLASAALPPVFSPVKIGDKFYIDGGIMNGFPVEPLQNKCDFIIGSAVNPVGNLNAKKRPNPFRLIYRTATLRVLSDSHSKFHQCDYVFSPPGLRKFGALDLRKVDEVYGYSYLYFEKNMAELTKLLERKLRYAPATALEV